MVVMHHFVIFCFLSALQTIQFCLVEDDDNLTLCSRASLQLSWLYT